MKVHKHCPVSGCGLARMWKLRFYFSRSQPLIDIDWETRTSRCHECAALIRVPKAFNIVWLLYPVISIPPFILCATVTYNLHLPWYLERIIFAMTGAFFGLLSVELLGSLAMAFGRWELVEVGEEDIEDVKQRLRKEVRLAKRKPSHRWLIVAGTIIMILSFVGTILLTLAITSS